MTNLLLNARMDRKLIDSSGRPLCWGFDPQYTDQTANGLCEFVTKIGPDGSTVIPALRCARDTGGSNGGGPMWLQQVYKTGAADNTSYTRDRPIPTVGADFPATFAYSIWTLGNNVIDSASDVPSAAIVQYTYDGSGAGTNLSGAHYFDPIGPNGGFGTWGWQHFTGTLEIHLPLTVVRADPSMGLHSQDVTGELFIAGGDWAPTLEAVA
jgi:hypothetical protein